MVSVRRNEAAAKGQYGPVRSAKCFVCGGSITLNVDQEGPGFYCFQEGIFLSDSGAFLLLGDKPNVRKQ